MTDRLLDLDELCELCKVGRRTVYKWNYRNTGPRRTRIGRKVMYRESDVQAWLDSRLVDQAHGWPQ